MSKYLNGSAGTGDKIMKNLDLFAFDLADSSPDFYRFHWSFDGQFGQIAIAVKEGKMSNSSLIDTDISSPHKFDRPLGIYNDPTLVPVFTSMLNSKNIHVAGIYSEGI